MKATRFWDLVSLIWVTISGTIMMMIAILCFIASESPALSLAYLSTGFLITSSWCYFVGVPVFKSLLEDKS